MQEEEGAASASDDLRVLLYFLPLRDPIPFPHGSTLSFELEGLVPGLEGVPLLSRPDLPPAPGTEGWRSFASLKFWQVNAPSDYYARHYDAVFKVIRAVKGGEAAEIRPSQPATITVVEMVTAVPGNAPPNGRETLLRCLNCLTDVIDAYRLSTRDNIPRLSFEQLGPLVAYLYRSPTEPYEWEGPGFIQLDHSNIKVLDPEPLDAAALKKLGFFLSAIRMGHPFSSWLHLCHDRDHAFHIAGDYRQTIIQAGLSVEVLVHNTFSCLLWEDIFPSPITDANVRSAYNVLNKDSRPLRAELGRRLRGDWGSDTSASVLWQKEGARIRNRVLHSGYRPTRDEAANAISAAVNLSEMIKERIAATACDHHRTAVLLLGDTGLERLGVLSNCLSAMIDESVSEPNWATSYKEWSQRISDCDPRIS